MRKPHHIGTNYKHNYHLTLNKQLNHKQQLQQKQNTFSPLIIKPVVFSHRKRQISDPNRIELSKMKVSIEIALRKDRSCQNSQKNKQPIRESITKPFQISRVHQKLQIKNYTPLLTNCVVKNNPLKPKQELQDLINETIRILIRDMILSSTNSTSFIIERQNFTDIIKRLIQAVIEYQIGQKEHIHSDINSFEDGKASISVYVSKKILAYKNQKLRLQKCVVNQNNNNIQQYEHEKQFIEKSLISLIASKIDLQNKINTLENHQKLLKRQCRISQRQMDSLSKQIFELKNTMKEETTKYQQLRANFVIKEKTAIINQKGGSLLNFVNKQKSDKNMQAVSEEFSFINKNFQQFLAYQQPKQLTSEIDCQPIQLQQIQRMICEEIQGGNDNMIQSKEMGIEEKLKMMKDFLLRTINFFKTKDARNKKIVGTKTQFLPGLTEKVHIQQVNMIFKQQCLVRMKREFIQERQKFQSEIQQLHSDFCQTDSTRVQNTYAKMRGMLHQIGKILLLSR